MRVSRPLLDDIPGGEVENSEVVADHARFISESFFRWMKEGREQEVDTSGIWEGIVWMK